jgi:ATP-binding cassette subfamily B protein
VDALTLSSPVVWQWFGAMVFLSAAYGLINYSRDKFEDYLRYHTEIALKTKRLQFFHAVPYAVLEDASFQNLAKLQEEKGYVLTNLQHTLVYGIGSLFAVLGLLTVFAYLPWQATALFLFAQVIRFYFLRKAREWSWDVLSWETREGRRGIYYQQTLSRPSSAMTAKSLDLVRPMFRRWKKIVDEVLRSKLKMSDATARAQFWGAFFESLGFALALFLILRSVLSGASAVSVAIVFISTYQRFQQAFGSLISNLNWLYKDAVYLPIVHAFFSYPVESDAGRSLPSGPLAVRFEDVYFRYPTSTQDILRGLTLSFSLGEHLALAGLNGAGKSTFLKLLMRMYEPTKGRITVNGVDLRAIKPSAWRQALSVLLQNDIEFDDLVRDQVRYGALDQPVAKQRFRMALSTSGLAEVLKEFPKGLDTHAGKQYAMPEENAIEFSGGQKQIVAITRTLYRDAKIYIFDEPTSAVDAEKEERFFEALPEALPHQAVIYVSHRFSVLRRAERIIVIDQGRVIEDGTHDELMAKEGRYAELFTLQAKMYQ